jgi:hypothetical protein
VHIDSREVQSKRWYRVRGFRIGDIPMTKELRTADQLSDMIVSFRGVNEIEIQIRQITPMDGSQQSLPLQAI